VGMQNDAAPIELPHDLAIPLLGIYPNKLKSESQRDIFTTMFITALFTIAKKWKQPKCPLMDIWIKKVYYSVEYYSV